MKIQIDRIYSYQHGGDARIICLDPIVSVDVQNGHIMRHQPDGKATEARCDLSEKEIPLKEYKLVIAMAGNKSFDEGDVIGEVIEGQRLPDEKDCWKIITVREVREVREPDLYPDGFPAPPAPPNGCHWESRGFEWKSGTTRFCFLSKSSRRLESGWTFLHDCSAVGAKDVFYLEAVENKFPRVGDKLRFKLNGYQSANEEAGNIVAVNEVDPVTGKFRTESTDDSCSDWTFSISRWKTGFEMAE